MGSEAADSVIGDVKDLPGDGQGTGETSPKARRLPKDLGYLLVVGGLIGVVSPGILGLDMLALGALLLWPGNRRRMELWLADHPSAPRLLRGGIKQIDRFLENLESRYPRA